MALSVSTQVSPVGAKLVVQDDATATADNNVTGAAAIVYMIQVDNSANGGQVNYLKLYNHNSPTVGTTAPNLVIMALGGADFTVAIPEGINFGTGLSLACVQEAGTAGVTSPTDDVVVRLVTS